VPEWLEGTWHNPPLAAALASGDFLVAAEKGSDAWRETAYGFVHDSFASPTSTRRSTSAQGPISRHHRARG
jgi:regulation of enolase protein 1 (concanavalin A-like superfamily)